MKQLKETEPSKHKLASVLAKTYKLIYFIHVLDILGSRFHFFLTWETYVSSNLSFNSFNVIHQYDEKVAFDAFEIKILFLFC